MNVVFEKNKYLFNSNINVIVLKCIFLSYDINLVDKIY